MDRWLSNQHRFWMACRDQRGPIVIKNTRYVHGGIDLFVVASFIKQQLKRGAA